MPRKIVFPGEPLSTQHLYKIARFGSRSGIIMTAEGKATKEAYGWEAKGHGKGNLCKARSFVASHSTSQRSGAVTWTTKTRSSSTLSPDGMVAINDVRRRPVFRYEGVPLDR